MEQVHVNGVNLDYLDEGTGIPVVFSHGGYSDLRYWEPQREVFAARYRFVAYSHRYHGSGTWPYDADYSANAHVADLLAIIRQLEAGPVNIVGFSTAIALRTTLSEPGLVRNLIIIEPNVPWLLENDPEGESVLAWWRKKKEGIDIEAAGDRERAARLWFELVNNRGPRAFDTQSEDFQRMWLENFNRKRPTSPPPEPLRCEQLSTITRPTLILKAEYGMPYSRRIVDKLEQCISGSRMVDIPGVTHFMSYQNPTVFNSVLLNFVAQHDD